MQPTSNSNKATGDHQSSIPIDAESLYTQDSYLTSLGDFLKEKNTSKSLLYWLTEFENPRTLKSPGDAINAIQRSISEIDNLINDQLNLILHTPRFQQLEASWRGLWYLAVQADGVKNLKVKVLDISWGEIVRDIDRALEFDQSQLFQKIYSAEYGSPGGEPYGILIGDYEISHRPSTQQHHNDLSTLEGIAEIAAAAFAPFVAGASSKLLGMEDFSKLGLPQNFHSIFSQTEYIKWRSFRDKSDSRFIGLTLPKVLGRHLYRKTPGSYKGLFFYEKTVSKEQNMYLWSNACYAFAGILIREFSSVGWFGHIRGVPRNEIGGGLVTNLTVDSFDTDAEGITYKPATDVVITDAVEREIGTMGLIPLCQCYDTPYAAFYSNQSVQRPSSQESKTSHINAKLSSMLQHVLCGSRIAHYIKVMIRDKVGSFISAEECEAYLHKWLFKYTTGRHDLEWDEQARYPLREASVRVREHPEKPGQFLCVIHMVPHYQIDQMVSELELVTELAQSG
ncbi:type VI secretion system contractile sheath large subunit [Teredinibacter haidensis]|uniref:type VI secretion system contractile sheath large subunit n=1 Tax=Teredinibacter haidensis TaxID=2731755 RepID=UPI000AFE258B|nr:type VI secretion system contractile sheath large subunit [Teredinibacter haidensis]